VDKLIIEVALNETVTRRENPHAPITQEEIARDAAECVARLPSQPLCPSW
jgi:uncharacterized protein (DUF849 family)